MVRRNYTGLSNPQEHFERLRPYRDTLLHMIRAYRPGGAEYMALHRAVSALDDAAGAVMDKPAYFHVGMPGEATFEQRSR